MAQAYPSLVGSEIWHWDTTQMGANGRTNQNLGVSGIGKCGHGLFIQQGGVWKCVGIFDLGGGKSSNEDDLSIPSSLKDLSWWEFRDI
jgi:hypothetical protein